MEQKTYQLQIASSVAINGEIKRPGDIVTVGESLARDLLRRGKAAPDATEAPPDEQAEAERLAAEQVEAERLAAEQAAGSADETAEEAPAAPAARKTPAKKAAAQ